MLVTFLDIEASGLQEESYPIEIGWSDNLGNCDSFLIRPHSDWTHWDPTAATIHGISRKQLYSEGLTIEEACLRLNKHLGSEVVFTDAADYDARWLQTLYNKARSQPTFQIEDVFDLYKRLPSPQVVVIQQIVTANPAPHRALSDCLRYTSAYMYSQSAIEICQSIQSLGIEHVLFICTANYQRSKTCQDLLSALQPGLEISSAGVSEKECERQGTTLCTEEMLQGADVIFTFEPMHKKRINEHTLSRFTWKIIELDIADRYQYMQFELLEQVSAQLLDASLIQQIKQLSPMLLK